MFWYMAFFLHKFLETLMFFVLSSTFLSIISPPLDHTLILYEKNVVIGNLTLLPPAAFILNFQPNAVEFFNSRVFYLKCLELVTLCLTYPLQPPSKFICSSYLSHDSTDYTKFLIYTKKLHNGVIVLDDFTDHHSQCYGFLLIFKI